jgi:hypothetical protein
MQTVIKLSAPAFSAAVLLVTLAGGQEIESVPTTDSVVAIMVQRDERREAEFGGYTATRHYLIVNKKRRAEMSVEVSCARDGVKEFRIVSEEGSYPIRKLVLHRMLKEETDASRPDTRKTTRITPANYDFKLIGKEVVGVRPAYVLQVTPRQENKYLIDGRIWVDTDDYSIVRIEGRPARIPSFWTRSVHFVHTYQKVGPFWLAASTHSVSDVRIYGTAEVTIDSSAYITKASPDLRRETSREARLTQ